MFLAGFAGVIVPPAGRDDCSHATSRFQLPAARNANTGSFECSILVFAPSARTAPEEEVVCPIGKRRIDRPVSVLEGRRSPYGERREQ
jgi:hypothetical protein